jgi:hypothetical protein
LNSISIYTGHSQLFVVNIMVSKIPNALWFKNIISSQPKGNQALLKWKAMRLTKSNCIWLTVQNSLILLTVITLFFIVFVMNLLIGSWPAVE